MIHPPITPAQHDEEAIMRVLRADLYPLRINQIDERAEINNPQHTFFTLRALVQVGRVQKVRYLDGHYGGHVYTPTGRRDFLEFPQYALTQ